MKDNQWNNKNIDRRSMSNYSQHETTIWRCLTIELMKERHGGLSEVRENRLSPYLEHRKHVAPELGRRYFQQRAILMLLYVLYVRMCVHGPVVQWLLIR